MPRLPRLLPRSTLPSVTSIIHPDFLTHSQIQEKIFPITCPEDSCRNQIQISIFKQLSPDLEDKFYSTALACYLQRNQGSLINCPTPDCKYSFEATVQTCKKLTDVRGRCLECNRFNCLCTNSFLCPSCNKEFCLACRAEHKGLSCFQFMSNKKVDPNFNAFVDLLRRNNYRKCPKCAFWVEKSFGCNHMVCRCKHEFCYKCNGEFQKCACLKDPHAQPDPNIFPRKQFIYKPVILRKKKENVQNTPRKVALKPTSFPFGFCRCGKIQCTCYQKGDQLQSPSIKPSSKALNKLPLLNRINAGDIFSNKLNALVEPKSLGFLIRNRVSSL